MTVTDSKNRKIVLKDWGHEEWIVNNDLYCGKELVMEAGCWSSLHCHPVKHETMMAIAGKCVLELYSNGADKQPMRIILKGSVHTAVSIPPYTYHRLIADQGPCRIIEFSTTHSDDDVVRRAPSRRADTQL